MYYDISLGPWAFSVRKGCALVTAHCSSIWALHLGSLDAGSKAQISRGCLFTLNGPYPVLQPEADILAWPQPGIVSREVPSTQALGCPGARPCPDGSMARPHRSQHPRSFLNALCPDIVFLYLLTIFFSRVWMEISLEKTVRARHLAGPNAIQIHKIITV